MVNGPRLETDRLVLRRWEAGDFAPFAALCADPEVMRYISDGRTSDPETVRKMIDRFEQGWRERGYGLFAVALKSDGRFIGFTGLSIPTFLPEILPSVEIGWRFARAHWERGYASEAAARALDFAVQDCDLTNIVSIYQTPNTASKRIMEKLGMVLDRQTIDPSCGRAVEVYRLPR